MSIRWRILLAFLLIAAFGLAALGRLVIKDLWPHTQQTAEESLAETATLLASVVEQSARAGDLDVDVLRASMAVAGQRSLQAKIHEVDKQRIDLRVYVTDARGVVLFDSDEHRDEGRDYSRWNDVKLTLLGRYGARATRDQAQDPFTSTLYVAAPIRKNGRIVGVLSVGKPVSALRPFFLVTSRRVITITLLLFAVAALLSLALAFWITRPIARLTDYARGISAGQRPRLPPLDGREIALLGESMEKMRVALEGQAYVENFVRSLTHELKAPLSAIRAAAELLNEEMAASDRERFLRNILSETARVQTLIDKLLALSSIETRQRIERRDGVALDDFVRETLDGATTLAARKHIQISARTGPATRIEGDAFL
ncbi:MAG: two-component system sensor histidine kinase CreC, partial [Vicinamibacteria bacterium]|nr:two-component system sensor histidine kinase CreC [Vicinamibacteria bacterium]